MVLPYADEAGDLEERHGCARALRTLGGLGGPFEAPHVNMKVVLRNPRREVEIAGGRRVKDVLKDLDVIPESVIVIRGDTLITADQLVDDADTIELRPVMSGGQS